MCCIGRTLFHRAITPLVTLSPTAKMSQRTECQLKLLQSASGGLLGDKVPMEHRHCSSQCGYGCPEFLSHEHQRNLVGSTWIEKFLSHSGYSSRTESFPSAILVRNSMRMDISRMQSKEFRKVKSSLSEIAWRLLHKESQWICMPEY